MKIIEITNLKKSYGNVEAVKGIDFYVEEGSLFAFLGPNGAGKSTTINMVCTLLKPDSGSIIINGLTLGRDDKKIRQNIGVVFQDNVLDPLLTVKENLYVRGSFYGINGNKLKNTVENAAKVTDIENILNRPYGKLSGGQKRRADIARALVNTPKILFLDEPTTGLDPQTRKSVWDTIKELQKNNGMTVFLTTHYMEEAASADYVAIIDNGLISAKGTPAELREKYSNDSLYLTPSSKDELERKLSEGNIIYEQVGGAYKIKLKSTMNALPIINMCSDYIKGFEVKSGNMDDAFIAITGRELRE